MENTKPKKAISKTNITRMWDYWEQGKSVSEIGRIIGHQPGSVHTHLRIHGGIRPWSHKRAEFQLSQYEREEISRELKNKGSFREIARLLNRAPSTISREVNRNGGRKYYRAHLAEKKSLLNRARTKQYKLDQNQELAKIVSEKLSVYWSPEQISGWLKKNYPNQPSFQISHETIYRTIFISSRTALDRKLYHFLRTKRPFRQAKSHTVKGVLRGVIKNAKHIDDRPFGFYDRSEIGHWEGDLIVGSNKSYIATLVDRKTRFTIMVKLKNNKSKEVIQAITKKFKQLPSSFRKTLTWDRGMEMARHLEFTKKTNVPLYLCDPRSPWQRGTNENTNKLIRQFLPKKTDIGIFSQVELNRIAQRLNTRPRLALDFLTPKQYLLKLLH